MTNRAAQFKRLPALPEPFDIDPKSGLFAFQKDVPFRKQPILHKFDEIRSLV